MAAFNHERYVAAALDSALEQSYENIEIVAVDDASTDSTPRILEEYARRHPGKVRVSLGEKSMGSCKRRNQALEMARGELICWLDSDDLWLPSKVEKQVAVMLSRPEVGMVYTDYEAFDSDTGATLPWGDTRPRQGDHLVPLFVEGCFIASLTIMFRRRVLEQRGLGLRDRDRSYGDDYQLHLVTALDWELAYIDEVLARYRRHPHNTSSRVGNDHLIRIGILREFLDEFPEARARLGQQRRLGLANHYFLASSHEQRHGSRARALVYLLRASMRDPARALRGPVRRAAGFARRVVAGAVAITVLAPLAVVALISRSTTAARRRRGERPRLVWGPGPPSEQLGSWSEAIRRRGYESTTSDEVASSRLMRDYRLFAWTLRNADFELTFFDGGYLRHTPLRWLEVRLLRLAGKKLVVFAHGRDIAVPGYLGAIEQPLLQDYATLEVVGPTVKRRVDHFAHWADLVVRGSQNGYLPRADVLWVTQLAIDPADYPSTTAESSPDGDGEEVGVIHLPDHPHVRGTAELTQAIEELREDGLRVRLDLVEGLKDPEMRRAVQAADLVADRLVAGYGMFGLQGLAAGKPVLSAVSGMPREARDSAAMRACPIVDADGASVKEQLRRLVESPELRARLGSAGRQFTLHYHSLEVVGRCWEAIIEHLWTGSPLPGELPVPDRTELDSPRPQRAQPAIAEPQ
jgi:glycosyltransferase involved in cell wall biosynthesis